VAASARPVPGPPRGYSARVTCQIYAARLSGLRPAHLELLTAAERARAARMRDPADAGRCALGAVLLRLVAGRALGQRPAEVPVERGCDRCGRPHGAPVLPGAGLHASVAHSTGLVVVALSQAGRVGVDVEAVTGRAWRPAVPAACGPAERCHIGGAADFYAYWTRKEAILKAAGSGLRRPMTELTVSAPGLPPAVLAVSGRPLPPCQLSDLPLASGYRGAVAVLWPAPVSVTTSDAAPLLLAAG
jgi:4'-phosphopantetheinyl transferase